ncbi:MAG: phosphate-starvation-inducible PsiE family protein [Gallionellaceae bacterium]|nr:phosphate-starvation-inducible PsiE family protein [Gallionellaceae bacterium]
MNKPVRNISLKFLESVEHVGLLVIAIATVVAMTSEIVKMIQVAQVTLSDLLLLFIYLEVFTMAGQYYRLGKLPVRFPLYIGMVALARYLILDMKAMDDWRMVAVTASILILAAAVLIIRFGHLRYPYPNDELPSEISRREIKKG